MSKNILSVASSLRGGGAERKTINVSNELGKENNVSVFILQNKIDYNLSELKNFELIIPKAQSKIPLLLELIRYIKTTKPNIIISYTRITNVYLGLIKPFISKKIKLIGFEPNLLNEIYSFSSFKKRVFLGLMKISYKKLDLLIYNSNDTKINIRKENISPIDEMIVHNPVLQNDYRSKKQNEVSHPFFNDEFYTFLMVGRLVPQKSYFIALRIFAKSLLSNPDYRLIILGVGPLLDDLKNYSIELQIFDKVDFCGFKDNVIDYMYTSNALLLTSEWEGFGNIIVESLSVGTPVLAINCIGGPKEIITSDILGYLADNEEDFLIKLNSRENFQRSKKEKELMIKLMSKFTIQHIIKKYKLS